MFFQRRSSAPSQVAKRQNDVDTEEAWSKMTAHKNKKSKIDDTYVSDKFVSVYRKPLTDVNHQIPPMIQDIGGAHVN